MAYEPLKNCLDCKHFYMNWASPCESDPGDSMEMGCEKDHWILEETRDDTESFRKKMFTAKTCIDYDPETEG